MPLQSVNHASVDQCQTKLKKLVLQSKQALLSERISNPLLDPVFHRLEELDYDETFFKVAEEHAKVIKGVIRRNNQGYKSLKFRSPEECLSYYTAKVFFDKLLLYQKLSYPVDINHEYPIKLLPIQAFLKDDNEARSKFEKSLKQYDILFVEVLKTSTALPTIVSQNAEYVELRIIAKVNLKDKLENEFLYHVNSHAFMFKNLELIRLGRADFNVSEVLKVTVLGNPKVTPKIFVTTNMDALRIPTSQKSSITLGAVPPEDVPFDLSSYKIASNFQSYSNYLRSQPRFYHTHNLKDQIASIGIDPFRIYSFYIPRDGMTISPNKTAASLNDSAKVAMHTDALDHLAKAKKFVEEVDYKNAEDAFEDSLKCWRECYEVYEIRGKMYLDLCKKKSRRGKFLKKAVINFETALKLNPSALEPKKCLSNIYSYVSKRLVKNKEYDSAKELVQTSLKLSPENEEATTLQQNIDNAIYVAIEEDTDLAALKMRKKLLKKQLEKEIQMTNTVTL